MKRVGAVAAVFLASLVGVLVAFQIDRFWNSRHPSSVQLLEDLPCSTPASYAQLPAGPADFTAAAKKLVPSIVSVDQRVKTRDFFSDRVSIELAGTGSGVVISEDGYILTNNHVVSGGDIIQVRMQDDKTYEAKVVGADSRSDLAVLKINAKGLTAADLGDSDKIQVGQWVIADGNPLGYSNTVSVGVVSTLKRTLPTGDQGSLLIDAIQTDAAINQGNSGGALANAQGQVIGINSAIASNSGGSIGIGFAIPINRAKRVVSEILKYGHVRYGDPGFTVYPAPLQDPSVQEQLKEQVNADPPAQGLVVRAVAPNSPAEQNGIRTLNVLESVDGKAVSNPQQFFRIFTEKKPGDKVVLKIWDAGQTKTVNLTLVDSASF